MKAAWYVVVNLYVALTFINENQIFAGEFVLDKSIAKVGAGGGVYSYMDNSDRVCGVYLKNLNTYANEPYGMVCGRKLDPRLGFTRPSWTPLDLATHSELARDIFRANSWQKDKTEILEKWNAFYQKRIQHNKPDLELAQLDLDGDGELDNLVRYKFSIREKCNAGKVLDRSSPERMNMIMANKELNGVQKDFKYSVVDDVILYKGKVYSDRYFRYETNTAERKKTGFDAILYFYEFNRFGTVNICRFGYRENSGKTFEVTK